MSATQVRRADIVPHSAHLCSPHVMAAEVCERRDVSSTQLRACLSSQVAAAA